MQVSWHSGKLLQSLWFATRAIILREAQQQSFSSNRQPAAKSQQSTSSSQPVCQLLAAVAGCWLLLAAAGCSVPLPSATVWKNPLCS